MKRVILLTVFFFSGFLMVATYGQVGKRIKESAKQTTEQKAEEKTAQGVGSTIDKGIDKSVEGIKSLFKKKDKKPKKKEGEEEKNDEGGMPGGPEPGEDMNTGITEPETPFGIYTKFTFIPGNKIIYYEDFSNDALGDFPVSWETSGSGEVVTNNIYEGKWLSITGRAGYLPSTAELPENYTIEFDMLTNGLSENNSATSLTIVFTNKKVYNAGQAGGHSRFIISLHKSARLSVHNTGAENTPAIGSTLSQKFPLDTVVHISIAVNKKRLRVWMEEEKIVDIPSLLVGNMGRYLLFETYGINPEKGQTVLLTNFRIAESGEDLRSKLLDSGRFSTTGIYFATDEAVIKQESFAVIKSVADYMNENPEVKIQVIGHTDAQGEEDYNQALSERRAQAVVESLTTQFGIQEARLSASGKGESEPVDDNSTDNGRANNRRVEFVRVQEGA